MEEFTVVCVYNNKDILNNNLLRSLESERIPIKTVLIDNCNHKFSSMAQAYNWAIARIDTPWVIMSHQDISFKRNTLEQLSEILLTIGNEKCGLIGVAGCKYGVNGVFSNIKYGPSLIDAGDYRIHGAEKVQTVDECFMIAKTELLKRYPFDAQTCAGWHLYGVEKCLDLSERKYINYVIGLELNHNSKTASMNSSYFVILKKLMNKYSKEVSTIYTTCGTWSTTESRRINWLFFKEKIKEILRRRT